MAAPIATAGHGRSLRPLLAGLVLLLAAACSSGPGGDQTPVATTTVDLPRSYRFAPPAITVQAGATVTWTNNDNFTHNVKFDGADPLMMKPGEQASHTFVAPGTYPYLCTLHPNDMTGTVTVTGS